MKTVEEMVSRATDLCSDAASYTYSPTRIRVIRGHLEPLAEALALREKALAVAREVLEGTADQLRLLNTIYQFTSGDYDVNVRMAMAADDALSEVSRLLAGEPGERS